MRIVKTRDGTDTLFNDKFQEMYHSVSGAKTESLKKYIEPCKIKYHAKKDNIFILDIGFGLGYNVFSAIDIIQQTNPKCQINITSLENDLQFEIIQKLKMPFNSTNILNKMKFNEKISSWNYKTNNVMLEILIGDATKTIERLTQTYIAVFLDPFSPKKNPELWSLNFFRNIYNRMQTSGILATYSCAKIVRKNLEESNFKVMDVPPVGRRGPSTIGIKF